MIHIEGMGVLGAFIAHTLKSKGLPFTWNDTGATNYWKAVRGCVGGKDYNTYATEARYVRWLGKNSEESNGFILDKNGNLTPTGREINFNVQNIVQSARDEYYYYKRPDNSNYPCVHAHSIQMKSRSGVNPPKATWSVDVELDFNNPVLSAYRKLSGIHLRPSVLLKEGLFLYPKPNTEKYCFGNLNGYVTRLGNRSVDVALEYLSTIAKVYSVSPINLGQIRTDISVGYAEMDKSASPPIIRTAFNGFNDFPNVMYIAQKAISLVFG